jgi:hypothetical protein
MERRGTMREQAEPEIHAYLDDLVRDGFYGELTLYFQNGDINNYRKTIRGGKNEIIEQYRTGADGKKKRVVLVTAKPKSPGAESS